jgi:hypothetical protein
MGRTRLKMRRDELARKSWGLKLTCWGYTEYGGLLATAAWAGGWGWSGCAASSYGWQDPRRVLACRSDVDAGERSLVGLAGGGFGVPA